MSSQAWSFLLFAGLAILAIVGYFIWDKKRTEALTAFAHSRGLTYQKYDNQWAAVDLGWPYGVGRSHRAKHVMTGEHNGRPIIVFEHHWVTGSGKERQTHQAMVFALQLPRALPKLEVTQEGVFSSVARRMGIKDIELESDDFNRAYKVTCENRRFAYDVLHPRFMEWMLANSADGFTISGPYLVWATSSRFQEEYVDRQLGYLDAIAEQVPAFVWTAE